MGVGTISKIHSIGPFVNLIEFQQISRLYQVKVTDQSIGNKTVIIRGPITIKIIAGLRAPVILTSYILFLSKNYTYDQVLGHIYDIYNRELDKITLHQLIRLSYEHGDAINAQIYTYLLELLKQRKLRMADINANIIYIKEITLDFKGNYILKLGSRRY